jgi:hypothetical protein
MLRVSGVGGGGVAGSHVLRAGCLGEELTWVTGDSASLTHRRLCRRRHCRLSLCHPYLQLQLQTFAIAVRQVLLHWREHQREHGAGAHVHAGGAGLRRRRTAAVPGAQRRGLPRVSGHANLVSLQVVLLYFQCDLAELYQFASCSLVLPVGFSRAVSIVKQVVLVFIAGHLDSVNGRLLQCPVPNGEASLGSQGMETW